MKAWVLHTIGEIRYEQIPKPEIADHEVLVSVKAAGICGSDIPRIYENGAHQMPLVPGHEFSGVVVKTGRNVSPEWLGKRVGIFPLLPCKKCSLCQSEHYEMCRNYSYLGSRQNGGFAEYAAVPEWNLVELPEQVSFEAAAMLEPMAVAVHAMRRIRLSKSDVIVICGLGTIGLLLLLFLREAGLKNILVIGNKKSQYQSVRDMGLPKEYYYDSSIENQEDNEQNTNARRGIENWIAEHTNGAGVDVFFECVGKQETFIQGIENTAPFGKIVSVGNPCTDILLRKEVYWKILRNQVTLTGTWNSTFTHDPKDDWQYVLHRIIQKRIQPETLISHRFSLENLGKGIQIMHDKTEDYGKIMGVVN